MGQKAYTILIDGDNINILQFTRFVDYLKSNGNSVQSTHLFGKLSSPFLADWKSIDKFIDSVITYEVSSDKKNSTDMKMCSTIFNLYYSQNLRNFALLSSDSDMLTVIKDMPNDANFLVGYSRFKVAINYINLLSKQHVEHIDLDNILGELSEAEVKDVINSTLHSYLQFKLGSTYFSYNAIRDWIVDRYPCLAELTTKQIINNLDPVTISFNSIGVKF